MFCKMLGSLNNWNEPMMLKITVIARLPRNSGIGTIACRCANGG